MPDRIVPLGERHLRKTLYEFATHYHRERNHQGLANELIERPPAQRRMGAVRRRSESAGSSTTTTGQPRRIRRDSTVGQNGHGLSGPQQADYSRFAAGSDWRRWRRCFQTSRSTPEMSTGTESNVVTTT